MAALDDVRSVLTRISLWIYIVFILHFALCMYYVSKAPGDVQYVVVEGLVATPPMQWAFVGFCLASVFFIVQAYIGAVYGIESHLSMYWYFLALSILVDVGMLFALIWVWLSAFNPVLLLSVSIVFKLAAMYVTSKYSKIVRNQYNAELLPHLKSALGRSFGVSPPEPPQFQPAPDRVSTMPEAYPHRAMYTEAFPLRGGPAQESPYASMPAQRQVDSSPTGDYDQAKRPLAPGTAGPRQAARTMPGPNESLNSNRLVHIVQ
mmetsp:Transcript_95190/g.226631  ORF Transcript_95190/g.226631 Transcript_95190/m.226631 type:complete len:262 (+) Transcript_95190:81-866(+)|eukprot:CAMPEP_0181446680 /NCGR_PEP_ID=MMETSP1110-20121109/26232_1 /TAXON_ID=174948 /ORGANISM="Symbiodinium sp., Strain CCMP421" /LENGTH=261 /DNA_ID=CAMNT_0023570771 /DNA_START=203 /DNA_END=988 /DNA_ORIENTATION=+